MTTGTKIIHGALSRIGAHSPVRPAGPESMEVSKDILNSMIAMYQDDNIDIGAVPLETEGNELSEPLGLTNMIMENLALKLQPLFPGAQISPELMKSAKIGYQDMIIKYQVITIPQPQTRETLPVGQGNKPHRHGVNGTFFKDGADIG